MGIAVLGKVLTRFFSPEKLLIPMVIFSQLFLFFSVFLLARKFWDKKTAWWTIFIFSCSTVQFRFYWYYYLGNTFALSFALITFYFLSSQSWWAILFSVLTIYFHRQVAVLLLATLFIVFLLNKKQKKYYSTVLIGSILSALVYYVPTFEKTIFPLLKPIFTGFVPQNLGGLMGTPSGSFYSIPKALILSLPYAFLGAYGFWRSWRKKSYLLITTPTLICLAIVILRVFFYRRFIPFLDLFLIFFAGYGAAQFFKNRRMAKYVYIAAMAVFITFFIHKTGHPLIEKDELNEIRMLSQMEQDAYVLVTDNWYTPWVYGWSDRKPIAPGFGEYDIYWTIPEWHQFWESNSRETEKNLLLKLPKPLYIYKGDLGSPIKADFSGNCFERINWRTYKFICDN